MSVRIRVALALCLAPAIAFAQGSPPVANPVATAFRENEVDVAKNLMAAAELMPADKYSFKPTPAQMSFGDIVVHLAQGNDFLCGAIGDSKAPSRAKVSAADGKEALLKRLKETFSFCTQALANFDDTKLSQSIKMFEGKMMTRAAVLTLTTGDWADHYSQSAIYLRLNGVLPPTAKKP